MLTSKSLTPMEWLSAGQSALVKSLRRHADKSIYLHLGVSNPSRTPFQKLALYAIKKTAGLRPKWPMGD